MTRALTFDDFERAVLAAAITCPEQALPLVPGVEIDDFGVPFHGHVWTAIRNLEAAGKPIDILAVADAVFAGYQLANDGKCSVYDDCEITMRLGTIVLETPHYGQNADEHCKHLAKYARVLRTIRLGREIYLGDAA